jgi:hypothetical protein
MLAELLPSARFIAFDREYKWAIRLREELTEAERKRFDVQQGDILEMPQDWSGKFDVATCQTLLMHLSDAEEGLQKLIDVVKPGGWIICAEPNNLYNWINLSRHALDQPVEDTAGRLEYWLRVRRGRITRGLGDMAVGESLTAMMAAMGLETVQSVLCDRMNQITPSSPQEVREGARQAFQAFAEQGIGLILEADVTELCVAGGAALPWAEEMTKKEKAYFGKAAADIADGRYIDANATILVLSAGRKAK